MFKKIRGELPPRGDELISCIHFYCEDLTKPALYWECNVDLVEHFQNIVR